MESSIISRVRRNHKLLGYYFIVGGVLGLAVMFMAYAGIQQFILPLILILSVSVLFFAFSIYVGVKLVKNNLDASKLAFYVLIPQLIQIQILGIGFKFVSGFGLFCGLNMNSLLSNFLFKFSPSAFLVHLNSDQQFFIFGFNLIAAMLLLFLIRQRKLVATEVKMMNGFFGKDN